MCGRINEKHMGIPIQIRCLSVMLQAELNNSATVRAIRLPFLQPSFRAANPSSQAWCASKHCRMRCC